VRRCAIYARYSSDLQSPSSIEDQIRLCRGFAERQQWPIVAIYEDRAISGAASDNRPGYQRLLAAALSRPATFDVILVEDLSRLTRDLGESVRLYRRLRLHGIDLVGVSDGIDTSRKGAAVHVAVKGLVNALFLEDLADKTHRGLSGLVTRGMSAGGKTFGYRAVDGRIAIQAEEADVVRRIFQDYADGRSMRTIAHALNAKGVPFPAKHTKRGPTRRGWAISTIQVILRNEKYAGIWTWNRTRFEKDPDTGRRRPVARPRDEWITQERPELRIVVAALWAAVQTRLRDFHAAFGGEGGRPPRGDVKLAYSPYLLSGLVRCGSCGARMIAQTATRKKGEHVYRYGWYRCSFARDKGAAICAHATWYPQARLEGELLGRFRDALTPAMIEALTAMVNAGVRAAVGQRGTDTERVKTEVLRLETEAGHLVRAIATGLDSDRVRQELRDIETALDGLRRQYAALEAAPVVPPTVHPTWVRQKLERLEDLLRRDPVRARAEIAKHLDGELTLTTRPSDAKERRAVLSGRVNMNGLLAAQEAVCLTLVAGAGFEPATFGL
jgi:site-specific DNA recombinase